MLASVLHPKHALHIPALQLGSVPCSWGAKLGCDTGSLYIHVSRVAWEAAKLGDKSLWLPGLEPCPGTQFCLGLMQSSILLVQLCVTLHDITVMLLFSYFFFSLPLPKVEVLSGMMTSLLQSHPLSPRQLTVSLVLKHPCSHPSTSLHLHHPGLLIRTGHIHPLIPDSPSLLQTWQAFLLHILQIQI